MTAHLHPRCRKSAATTLESASGMVLCRSDHQCPAPYSRQCTVLFMLRFRLILLPVVVLLNSGRMAELSAADSEDPSFSRDVLPILSENCYQCHGPDEGQRTTELRLDDEQSAADVLNRPHGQDSELLRRIEADDPDSMMPPADSNLALTAHEKMILRRWIESGSTWGQHWSFEPLTAPPVPEPVFPDIPAHNPIDRFIQARLPGTSLTPSPIADRNVLLRRLTLDLTGLPPTPEEQQTFLNDTEPGAWERVVDRLLASPAYGERMAWDWLNAARYADSNGYQGDRDRTMWPWREWVVDAFNSNMPFDTFTIDQLAGDLLPKATFEQQLATGFCRNHMINGEGGRIPEENRVDYVMDMTETMGTVWLGLTLNCCRCHDHKFDPLRQQDYYQLFAFFNQTPVTGGGGDPATAPSLAAPTPADRKRLAAISQELDQLAAAQAERATRIADGQPDWERTAASSIKKQDPLQDDLDTEAERRSPEQRERIRQAFLAADTDYAALTARLNKLQKQQTDIIKRGPTVMVMADQQEQRDTFILDRGLYNVPTEQKVKAATPASLPALPDPGDRPLNRLDLARWLMSADNPLTARVTVNRFWQQIFGQGLVKTTEDFGVQGEYPVQKDLLNWLAADFRDNGWDVKRLVRQVVTSHTYRQSSVFRQVTSPDNPEQLISERELDPDNRLLARSPRYRWPSFVLRDQALAACGLLNPQAGGPPVHTYQPPGVWAEPTFGKKKHERSKGDDLYRRSLYIFWRRIVSPTVFFDNASRQTCMVKVLRTNTPLHSLLTLNETTYVESARTLGQSLLEDTTIDDQARLQQAFRRIVCRDISAAEFEVFRQGLERSREEYRLDPEAATALLSVGDSARNESLDPAEHAAWTALCLAVLNLDETLTRE